MPIQLLAKPSPVVSQHGSQDRFLFIDGIPEMAEEVLETLYESLMCTLLRLYQYYPLEAAKTYIAYKNNKISSFFIFEIQNHRIVVHNEQIFIEESELIRFSLSAFEKYPTVSSISFYAIDTALSSFPFIYHIEECLEDIRLSLPKNFSEYVASLGKKTASALRRAEKKMLREHPSFKIENLSKHEVSSNQINAIINLNRLRMHAKGTASHHTDESNIKLMALIRKYGFIGIALIEGEICGGFIQMRIGAHWFANTIAHHPRFDEYQLGHICNYHRVAACIENGGGTLHFGWGRFQHKYRFGAKIQPLMKIEIYRNAVSLFKDFHGVCARITQSRRRRLKIWITEHEKGENRPVALVIRNIKWLRSNAIRVRTKFNRV
jgi:hypothetical protein